MHNMNMPQQRGQYVGPQQSPSASLPYVNAPSPPLFTPRGSSSVSNPEQELTQQFHAVSIQAPPPHLPSEPTLSSSSMLTIVEPKGPPVSSKKLRFPTRPGKGQTGIRCIVKANHFFAELPNKDLHQYDVCCFLSSCS